VHIHHDGLRIAGLDWGGDDSADGAALPLLLLHPNGFCAGLFDPLARRVRDTFRPVGVDLRGQGATDAPAGRDRFAYELLAGDVIALLDSIGVTRCVALGQSLGGGVAITVDRLRPGLIQRMVLCEAIAFPHMERSPATAAEGGVPPAAVARKRRAVWPDRATVVESYGSRPPLGALAPEALEAYFREGFHDRADGRVGRACDPEVEATVFEVTTEPPGAPSAWEHLDSLHATAAVLCGDASDLPHDWFDAQAERAGVGLTTLAGGHFFLQEDTARAEHLVREHLA